MPEIKLEGIIFGFQILKLDHIVIYAIKYDNDKQKPEFIKWNHTIETNFR